MTLKEIENYRMSDEGNLLLVSIDPDIYPLEVVYSATYMFLDKAYVMLDGDPKENITVQFKAKEDDLDLEKLLGEFQNELINYSVYAVQAARTSEIREAITKRALKTVEEGETESEDEGEWVEDPKGIAETWSPEKAEGIETPEGEADD